MVLKSQWLFDFVHVQFKYCRVMEFELCYKGTKLLLTNELVTWNYVIFESASFSSKVLIEI